LQEIVFLIGYAGTEQHGAAKYPPENLHHQGLDKNWIANIGIYP
jgi:hypothetical protein